MSHEAIRTRLNRHREQQDNSCSENEKLLLDAVRQLTVAMESDLTQIKAALGHVARLLEVRRDQ